MLSLSEVSFMKIPKSSPHVSFEMPSRNTLGQVLERMIVLIDEERYGDAEALENEFLELTDYE